MRKLIMLFIGMAALTAYGQGTIRYVNLGGILFNSEAAGSFDSEYGRDTAVDFDGNGTTDMVFRNRSSFTQYLVPPSTSAAIGQRATPPDVGSVAIPLPFGTLIGQSTIGTATWLTSEFLPPYGPVGPLLSDCFDFGCLGQFVGQTAYLGVHFEIDGQDHYGWMHLKAYGGFSAVFGYGYNTVPNIPILAGQVPEPSIWLLLVGGSVALVLMRRQMRSN